MRIQHGILTLILSLSGVLSQAEPLVVTPFDETTWSSIKAHHQGQDWILKIWAVSCTACLRELPVWAQLINETNKHRVTFLQADTASMDHVQALLTQVGFKSGDHFSARDEFEDTLRFSIYPSWQGETPATLMFRSDGTSEWVLGTMTPQQISDFLKK